MDKSLEARRIFTASNKRMLDAVNALAAAGEQGMLERINLVMPVTVYEQMIDQGFYSSVKRKRQDRRSTDRRNGDRRHSGKR
ncbi:MAG: hypothetical protein JEZ04_03015 [Spirochaetales bacterium]|nr:hypothetical protein [Spirochaetales bacterium]